MDGAFGSHYGPRKVVSSHQNAAPPIPEEDLS
jgi:hypothetical protein